LKKQKRYRLFFVKAENADLKARLERLERLVRNKPYVTASVEPTE